MLTASTAFSAEATQVRGFATPGKRPVVMDYFDGAIPHWVDGGSWKTNFLITNLDTKTSYFEIFFTGPTGDDVAVPLVGYGNVYGVQIQLAANQSIELETPGTASALLQGAALIFSFDRPATDPASKIVVNKLGGYAIFRQRNAGRSDFEAVVPFSPLLESKFTLFFDNRSGYSTGVALFNSGIDTGSISVIARDRTGAQLLTDVFVLSAFEKLVFSSPERYPALRNQAGILQFNMPASYLSGLALRFNPGGAFTSAHSLSLPSLP